MISCFTLAPDIKTWTCEFLPENKKIVSDTINSDTPQFIVGSPDKVLKLFDCNGVELFDFYGNIEEDDDDDDDGDDDDDDDDDEEEGKNVAIRIKVVPRIVMVHLQRILRETMYL